MKPVTIQQIRQAVGGKSLSSLPAQAPMVTAVCIDSRRMEPGSLFVAIQGDRFDGHDFLPAAAAGGAVAALVQHPPVKSHPNLHLLQVDDTRVALGKLATYVRRQLRSKVIAVAGSNGKTSTKHLINAALCVKFRGSISPKSFNNDIGVPLTIFPADPNQDYLVLEMGTNHPGEIPRLAQMALPDIAVITNCSAEHLEFLGDLMGVRKENAGIVKGLKPRGRLIVNGDDEALLAAVAPFAGKRITFGFKPTNDLFATQIECSERGVYFHLNNSRRNVFVPMLGRHSACNALAAIAVARVMGVDEEMIFDGLAEATRPEMRLQVQKIDGVTLINDAYNANPASMRAALETMVHLPCRGRRIAVLGDMRELGEASDRYHREIGQFAADCELDILACVGNHGALIAQSACDSGMPSDQIRHYADAASAAAAVPRLLKRGDVVLLKASRGVHLESVAQAIVEHCGKIHRRAAS